MEPLNDPLVGHHSAIGQGSTILPSFRQLCRAVSSNMANIASNSPLLFGGLLCCGTCLGNFCARGALFIKQ